MGVTQIDQESSGTVPLTVPATPVAFVEVGRELPVDQVGDAETMEDMLDALAVDLEADDGRWMRVLVPKLFPLTDDATLEMPNDAAEGWCWSPCQVRVPIPTQTWNCWRMVRHWEASTTLRVWQSKIVVRKSVRTRRLPLHQCPMATRGLTPAVRAALVVEVDLDAVFIRRAVVVMTVPKFLRGPYRSAVRLGMEEALHENDQRRERGWKLFLLLLRLRQHPQRQVGPAFPRFF